MTVRLILTLKQSVRRCLYRCWEGQVVRWMLRIKTVDLERMYRGNPLTYRQGLHYGQSLYRSGQVKGSKSTVMN